MIDNDTLRKSSLHDGSPLCKLLAERIERSGLTHREISEAMAPVMGDRIPKTPGFFLRG